MNRWTINELEQIDDLTFAMCILSERRGSLNQESPLAKKLRRAYHTLDKLRGGQPISCNVDNALSTMRHRIYDEIRREYELEDIKSKISNMDRFDYELRGLTAEQLLGDDEIMNRIVEIFDKSGCGEDYWYIIENAIEVGISDILESRKE